MRGHEPDAGDLVDMAQARHDGPDDRVDVELGRPSYRPALDLAGDGHRRIVLAVRDRLKRRSQLADAERLGTPVAPEHGRSGLFDPLARREAIVAGLAYASATDPTIGSVARVDHTEIVRFAARASHLCKVARPSCVQLMSRQKPIGLNASSSEIEAFAARRECQSTILPFLSPCRWHA